MPSKRWLPLESNPVTMNNYCENLGLETGVASFHEVYGLDPELLAMVPSPVYAVLLLFPITEASEEAKRTEEVRIEREGQTLSFQLYFMKQTVGNACGTIGILHAIMNNAEDLPIRRNSFFEQFYERTKEMTPLERAKFLEEPKEGDPDIELAHQSAAESGETRTPGADEKVNLHFVCFAEKEGGLYEFDGRKKFPVYHGPTQQATILRDAAQVARTFMAQTESIQFNIMALALNDQA